MKSNAALSKPRVLELLAPARNADIAIAAIDHGADAVYIGAAHHGARHAAGNSLDDIARVVEYAHRFDARVYVTLNTLVYDNETVAVKQLVDELYRIGVDALIVQDMALLEMSLPPIALHASTQCDIRTPERARFLQDAGFSQLVLARELTLDEIKEVRAATTVPLEAFVHGALCVSYSGNCQASQVITGRSANRGECAQMCRLPYDLIDGDGNRVIAGKHLLSLRDMNRIKWLGEMIDAGIDSFKIEGRLKDIDYVKTVVSSYSQELDRIVASRPELTRRSKGRVMRTFEASLADSFNRGYTDYFLHNRRPSVSMASIDTPKSAGVPVGTVKRVNGKTVEVKSDVEFANGDGLTYFDRSGKLCGFRVNRADGNKLQLTAPADLRPGTRLFRNHDARREAMMARTTARRVLDLDMVLRPVGNGSRIALDITLHEMPRCTATATAVVADPSALARTDQTAARRDALAKLGGTSYSLLSLDDRLGPDFFVPMSVITSLRREALGVLEVARRASYCREVRRYSTVTPALEHTSLDYTDNVANRLADRFYRRAGATEIEPAIECAKPRPGTRVMLTRYCLRRELDRCLRTPQGSLLKGPLKLRGAGFEFDLNFDCARCEMSLHTPTKQS